MIQDFLIPPATIPERAQVFCPICWLTFESAGEMIAHIGHSHTKILWQKDWIYDPQHPYWELAYTKLNNITLFPALAAIYRNEYITLCSIKESERRNNQ